MSVPTYSRQRPSSLYPVYSWNDSHHHQPHLSNLTVSLSTQEKITRQSHLSGLCYFLHSQAQEIDVLTTDPLCLGHITVAPNWVSRVSRLPSSGGFRRHRLSGTQNIAKYFQALTAPTSKRSSKRSWRFMSGLPPLRLRSRMVSYSTIVSFHRGSSDSFKLFLPRHPLFADA